MLNECEKLIQSINSAKVNRKLNIMEVCGTHTMAISKFGFRNSLNNINFVSGPGCPVCVTSDVIINYIYKLSLKEKIIIATFGDMLKVPGSKPYINLENAAAIGASIKVVYSSFDALKLADQNRDKLVVFLGIGFETTAPSTAVAIKEAKIKGIDNFKVLSLHKRMEPVMVSLLKDKKFNIDGFLCPGHVAMVIGADGFDFLKKFSIPSVISGFEAKDILIAIRQIVDMIIEQNSEVRNAYKYVVKEKNFTAAKLLEEVFEEKKDIWRGIGFIENSGFKIKEEYAMQNIETIFPVELKNNISKCKCGEVLKGIINPNECAFFGKICTPLNPVGPCMVSREGSCAAYYKYDYK